MLNNIIPQNDANTMITDMNTGAQAILISVIFFPNGRGFLIIFFILSPLRGLYFPSSVMDR